MITLGFLLFFLWQGLSKDPLQIPSPLINKPIPKFVAASLGDSKKLFTEKMFFGHVSLLVVWSSWCSHCLAEHALLKRERNARLQIIGLNYRDNLLSAKNWLSQYGNPYNKVIFDPKGLLGINLGVYGVPESFLLDEKGIIRYKHIGPLNEYSWNAEIRPWLEG
ncbi:MAG: DsbE family thiol:disulfide interchange protein [Pseudomonadota bacterium]